MQVFLWKLQEVSSRGSMIVLTIGFLVLKPFSLHSSPLFQKVGLITLHAFTRCHSAHGYGEKLNSPPLWQANRSGIKSGHPPILIRTDCFSLIKSLILILFGSLELWSRQLILVAPHVWDWAWAG